MTPSPLVARSMACRLSINPSSTSTAKISLPSTRPSCALPTPTNSNCVSRGSAPPPTPPAKKLNAKWPTSSASPESDLCTFVVALPQARGFFQEVYESLFFSSLFVDFPGPLSGGWLRSPSTADRTSISDDTWNILGLSRHKMFQVSSEMDVRSAVDGDRSQPPDKGPGKSTNRLLKKSDS